MCYYSALRDCDKYLSQVVRRRSQRNGQGSPGDSLRWNLPSFIQAHRHFAGRGDWPLYKKVSIDLVLKKEEGGSFGHMQDAFCLFLLMP